MKEKIDDYLQDFYTVDQNYNFWRPQWFHNKRWIQNMPEPTLLTNQIQGFLVPAVLFLM